MRGSGVQVPEAAPRIRLDFLLPGNLGGTFPADRGLRHGFKTVGMLTAITVIPGGYGFRVVGDELGAETAALAALMWSKRYWAAEKLRRVLAHSRW